MKKLILSVCVIVLFSIGFAASGESKDETKSSSSPVEESEENVAQQSESTPKEIQLIGSKDVSEVENKIAGTIWTYTEEGSIYWTKLEFVNDICKVYEAMPQDGKWKFSHSTPYYITEKRLEDGHRHVFVYLRYEKDGKELPYPMGINITDGSFIYGAMGAIGYIRQSDYIWD